MQVSFTPYQLELNHPFSIANFSRTSTPVMLLKLTYENVENAESVESVDGYGEAAMVPYMGESIATATAFLNKVDWNRFIFPFDFENILAYLDGIEPGQPAIKAAIDIALHDITGKLEQKPCYQLFGADPLKMPVTSYTIGIDSLEVIRQKVAEANGFKVLKIKLGRDNDKELIETIRSVSDLPLYIDANQGWKDKAKAIDMIYWLHDKGALLIEQPMDKADMDGNAWLTGRSPIPIIADEAVQRLADMDRLKEAYHGINVKLMKSAGMYEAHQMILKARSFGMKVLMGCMTETSCATQAGIALAPLCNWADLDGPWLTKNNPFKAPEMRDGKYIPDNLPGLGLAGIPADLFTSA